MKKVLFYLTVIAVLLAILWLIGIIIYIAFIRSKTSDSQLPTSLPIGMSLALRFLMIAIIALLGAVILYFLRSPK